MRKKALLAKLDAVIDGKLADGNALFQTYMRTDDVAADALAEAKIAYQDLKAAKDKIASCQEQAVIQFIEQYGAAGISPPPGKITAFNEWLDYIRARKDELTQEATQYFSSKMGARDFSPEKLCTLNQELICLKTFEAHCSQQGAGKLEPIMFAFGMLAAHAPDALNEILLSFDPDALAAAQADKPGVPERPKAAGVTRRIFVEALEQSDVPVPENQQRHELLQGIRKGFAALKQAGLLNGIHTAPDEVSVSDWSWVAGLAESTVPCPTNLPMEIMTAFWDAISERQTNHEAELKVLADSTREEFKNEYLVPGFGIIVCDKDRMNEFTLKHRSEPDVVFSLKRNLVKLELGLNQGATLDIYDPNRTSTNDGDEKLRFFKVGRAYRAAVYTEDPTPGEARKWLLSDVVHKKDVEHSRGGIGYSPVKLINLKSSCRGAWEAIMCGKKKHQPGHQAIVPI